MPVFKIAAKRVARKEKEDANGLSAIKAKMRDMGEDVDTDSDDSDESDNGDESEDESEDEGSVLSDEDGESGTGVNWLMLCCC
jgi:hypothetical protein